MCERKAKKDAPAAVVSRAACVSRAPLAAASRTARQARLVSSHHSYFFLKEIEKFIIRQPPKGEKDDYDSENSWISDGLPSSSRRRRRGDGR